MSRIKFAKQKSRIDKKIHYSSIIFPEFKERSDDVIIKVDDYTRLDVIAQDAFNDPTLWWAIAAYNNISGNSLFTTGLSYIRIPADIQIIFDEIKKIN
jgi:hypothetical protein